MWRRHQQFGVSLPGVEQMGNQIFEPDEHGVADAGFHGASSISLFLSPI